MDFTALLALLGNLAIMPFGDVNLAAAFWTVLIILGLSMTGIGFEGAAAAGAGFLLLFGATVFIGGGGIMIIVGAAIGIIVILGLMRIFRK